MKFPFKVSIFFVFMMISGAVFGDFSEGFLSLRDPFSLIAFAEDDDEYDFEDESEDNDFESISQVSSKKSTKKISVKTKQVIQNVIEYKPVTKTVMVTEEEYKTDSDGDLLVDAIDPNPLVKQSEYFTDTDGDGVSNVFDRHHDEDDFLYFDDAETDMNNNGILDSYEQ